MPSKGQIFTGPREPVIPRERKYHLRKSREHDEYRPTIVYVDHQSGRLDEYEAIYTEDPWTQVVNDINDIARDHTGATGGTFYVNEYKQVIKPVGTGPIVDIFVGEYRVCTSNSISWVRVKSTTLMFPACRPEMIGRTTK